MSTPKTKKLKTKKLPEMKFGLKPRTLDKRDFKFGSLFPQKVDVPLEDFEVGITKIKDQRNTMFCTAFGTSTASELQENVELSPEYQAGKINQLGENIAEEGAELRIACKSLIKFGSLETIQSPYDLSNQDPYF